MSAKLKISSAVFLFTLLIPSAFSKPVIGYGSSDFVLPAHNQELFFMGFELGLKHTLTKKFPEDFLLVDHAKDKKALSAARVAKKFSDTGLLFITGFPTSHEALLAADIATKAKTLAIFPAASHLRLASFGTFVYTTGESMQFMAKHLIRQARLLFGRKEGGVISNPSAAFSSNLEETLQQEMLSSDIGPTLSFFHLNPELRLREDDIQLLRKKKPSYLLFTAYPDESFEVLDQLNNSAIDVPFLANPAWTTGDIELLRRALTKKRGPTYSLTSWLENSVAAKKFISIVGRAYRRRTNERKSGRSFSSETVLY